MLEYKHVNVNSNVNEEEKKKKSAESASSKRPNLIFLTKLGFSIFTFCLLFCE